ncbi:MAG: cell division protein FtsB [Hydrogenophilales bacterium CG03_land_8_20_14_0_80_62_28]|nr:cell division protein FtsB [Betaproteobacteria bacterium]OIO79503.1 MAG: cell division protein FtsB [Hydrogenophilaceae bacterium CG1_02_62_390]PIV21638.1 MAG: cell division protein FtsB [Hydrogenophilales bacterium CG03_land_8_20_14_0_80_62_28]PIW38158.1 MAG: cell division protein FtsB [Hydrogenophilales bacterium CG15_BIG_FIL_POST_REV_8_21_14_020_62_31]PIW71356.1 MAG: cell division protein FtsB [Hydrogenophilales bacterium CG12_big_fil_rev_8_21_14_0_65_61_21]PIX00502.1 MAG: cell division 
MKTLTWVLALLILSLQYPLWLGKGSWLKVWDLRRQIAEQQIANGILLARNDQLAAEVGDLKTGYGAIESRARYELGMIRQDETFFQTTEPTNNPAINQEAKP